MADSRGTASSNPNARHNMRVPYKNCNHDLLPELPNFKSRTQRMNMEKNRHMKPAEFASLLCEKLEKLKLNNEEESRRNENQIPVVQDQRLSSPYHHGPGVNMAYPSYYPADDYLDDSQSWIMPPASDRYSVAGASSHSSSGANTDKNRNIKEKAKELRNTVHHYLRNGLGECECHSCDIKRQEKAYQSKCNKDFPKHSLEYCHRSAAVPGNPVCCCHAKDNYCTNQSYPLFRKYNSEESSHRTVDYPHENINEDFVPPIDNTKIYAWMERNDRLKHERIYPDHMPSPAVRRKKQPKDYENNPVTQTVQPIAQDLGMPLLPQPDTGNVLEEVKRVLEEPEQRLAPIKKAPSRTHQPPLPQQQYHYVDQHGTYSTSSYENTGSLTTTNWSLSDTHSRSSHNPSQISTVPSSASRLWNPEGYYDSSSDVRLEHKSGASRSHSTGTGRHGSQHHTSRSDHRSSNTRSNARSDSHNDMLSQRTGRSHGSDGNKTPLTTVTYFFGVDPIPFRISVPSEEVTLGQFSKSLTKKGNFRFFFKTISEDDGEVVYEEIRNENEILPRFKDKIIGKVEKIE